MGRGGRQTPSSFLLGSRGARRKRCWRCTKTSQGHQRHPDGGGRDVEGPIGFPDGGCSKPSTHPPALCHSCRRAVQRYPHAGTAGTTSFRRLGLRRDRPTTRIGSDFGPAPYHQAFSLEGHGKEDTSSPPTRGRAQEPSRGTTRSQFTKPGIRPSPTEHGHHGPGCSPHRPGPYDGFGFEQFYNDDFGHQRGAEEGSHDERSGIGKVPVLPSIPTATSPEDAAHEACSHHPRGVRCLRCVPPQLFGALWRIPPAERTRLRHVATWPHLRRCQPRELAHGPRTCCSSNLRCRTSSERLWRLEPRHDVGSDFRPPGSYVPGEDDEYDGIRPGIRSFDTSPMGSHCSQLHEGDGDLNHQKVRGQEDEGGQQTFGRQGVYAFTEEEAEVPEKAEGECRVRDPPGLEAPREQKPGFFPGPTMRSGGRQPPGPTNGKQSMHEMGHDDPRAVDFCLDFPRWCSSLLVNCLRSRTPFSAFLAKSTVPSRVASSPSSSVFPLPVPSWSPFERMSPNASSRRRRSTHFARAFHTVIMALNFWHGGGDFGMLQHLSRPISPVHSAIFRRVKNLMRADGQFPAFPVIRAGRRFPQLVARLREATDFICHFGAAADPYNKQFPGSTIPFNNDLVPELEPYRDADPSRITLSGTGHWDVTDLLSDDLCMPYREPDCIKSDRVPPPGERPHIQESPEDVAALARLWDKQKLLFVHNQQVPPEEWTRVFGAFKDEQRDRQIGDRRGRNYTEDKTFGPSAELPSGPSIAELVVDRQTQMVRVCVTDRRDFYHQIWATKRRAISNTLGPGVPISLLEGTSALEMFLEQNKRRRRSHDRRLVEGDFLHEKVFDTIEEGMVHCSFKAVLQGDHAGVEIACSAHGQLLRNAGLLVEDETLEGKKALIARHCAQGLCIDDYFCVAVHPKQSAAPSTSARYFGVAQRCYQQEGLLGSADKDILEAPRARAIGAEISGDQQALQNQVITVSSPASKRYALSWISLMLSQLPSTSDSLHLSLIGGWVSAMMFRRPMMQLLQHSFGLVDSSQVSSSSAKLVGLPRRVANELVLLSALCPLMSSDITVPHSQTIYASDASNERGAVVEAEITEDVQEALHRSCKSKGTYTKLSSPQESMLRRIGILEEGDEEDGGDSAPKVPKPLAFQFVFIEIYAGSAKVTKEVAALGFSVGPPIELSRSEEYNLQNAQVIAWLTHLLMHRKLLAFMCEPPCTTFSIMRRPALRDAEHPYGFDPGDPQTATGNMLACRSFQMMAVGEREGAAGLLETPNSSKLKNLPSWNVLSKRPGSSTTRCDSCRYGSPHLKSFRFLCVNFKPHHAALRCQCTKPHLQVQGQYTKASATYTDALASALALDFAEAIRIRLQKEVEEESQYPPTRGLENQLVNEVVLTSQWREKASWKFRRQSHINLLELKSVLRLVSDLVKEKKSVRFCVLVDSIVTKGSVSKGRSSSVAVSSILRHICSFMVAGGLYAVTPFVPTRHNTADDPTRDRELRAPISGMDLKLWSRTDVFKLANLPGLRRWISNWARLIILLSGPQVLQISQRNIWRSSSKLFDSTLGYPGEGPFRSSLHWMLPITQLLLAISSSWIFSVFPPLFFVGFSLSSCFVARLLSPSRLGCLLFWLPLFMCVGPCHGMEPRNPADITRARHRSQFGPLPQGRQVLPVTRENRERYLRVLFDWADGEQVDVRFLIENCREYIEELNMVLVRFGRALYHSGRPHAHFIEVLNALTSWKPIIRRQLQESWDLAFTWVRLEPSAHHVAAPFQAVLAMCAVALMWGWSRVAGALAMCFGGLLRPGEFISAGRDQLLLPSDVARTISYCLVTILEPKTRFRAAKHQYAKIDAADMVLLTEIAFSRVPKGFRLWPLSGQTLRSRFQAIMTALDLPLGVYNEMKALDLGSLRAGGATWLMQVTESGDLVKRRGRWISEKIMSIYLQETTALQYLKAIPENSQRKVLTFAKAFPAILRKAKSFHDASIPADVWYLLFKSQQQKEP